MAVQKLIPVCSPLHVGCSPESGIDCIGFATEYCHFCLLCCVTQYLIKACDCVNNGAAAAALLFNWWRTTQFTCRCQLFQRAVSVSVSMECYRTELQQQQTFQRANAILATSCSSIGNALNVMSNVSLSLSLHSELWSLPDIEGHWERQLWKGNVTSNFHSAGVCELRLHYSAQ